MEPVKLIWITPEAERTIVYIARASNPESQAAGLNNEGLLRFCLREGHVSPFDMACMAVEINTQRNIGRQLLRHWSFKFQEFSQRYQDVSVLPKGEPIEARRQHPTNRQSSISLDPANPQDKELDLWWRDTFRYVRGVTESAYTEALRRGIAKEVARDLLQESEPTRMYMQGTIRSWIHFCLLRAGNGTQKETTKIANRVAAILHEYLPTVATAANIHKE